MGVENLGFRVANEARDWRRFGADPRWRRLRFELGRRYWLDTPYAIVRREGAGGQELIWGETPCATLLAMLRGVDAGPQDVFYDLGCGRGLTVMFAHLALGMRAEGWELLPSFVARARDVSRQLGLDVAWHEGSWLEADLSGGTVAFLAWTTYPPPMRREAERRLSTLQAGARVITLTHPLQGEAWTLLDKARLRFSWGWGTVYSYVRTPSSDDG